MKRTIITILTIIFVIICIVLVKISNANQAKSELMAFNRQFEQFKDKEELYGADVLTLINKSIYNNKTYEISRDDEGNFIQDDEHSIEVIITLLMKDDNDKAVEVTRPMEALEKRGLDEFMSGFATTPFECDNIEYNSLGRVSKISVKQLEL